ncbi:MAG: hypothetical protein WB543_05100, partial [Candidatus Acidiferrum sp.]
ASTRRWSFFDQSPSPVIMGQTNIDHRRLFLWSAEDKAGASQALSMKPVQNLGLASGSAHFILVPDKNYDSRE